MRRLEVRGPCNECDGDGGSKKILALLEGVTFGGGLGAPPSHCL